MGFYYGHPQNIFWWILAEICKKPEPVATIEERKAFALQERVALWDVLHAADIDGASDASIRNPEPNQFAPLLQKTQITTIFATGKTATRLFNTLCADEAGMQAIYLPSTSPANRAQQSRPKFLALWQQVAKALG
jgi:hypoxanthine-DNA glycosylase